MLSIKNFHKIGGYEIPTIKIDKFSLEVKPGDIQAIEDILEYYAFVNLSFLNTKYEFEFVLEKKQIHDDSMIVNLKDLKGAVYPLRCKVSVTNGLQRAFHQVIKFIPYGNIANIDMFVKCLHKLISDFFEDNWSK